MNCKKCGSPLNPNDKFCMSCGTPVEQNNVANVMPNVAANPAQTSINDVKPVQTVVNEVPKVNPAAPIPEVKPVEPVTPVAPVKPVEPVTPVTPVAPAAPAAPVKPAESVAPVEPVEEPKTVNPVAQMFDQESQTANAPVSETPKKNNILLFIIIALVLVAASVAGTIFFMNGKPVEKPKETNETSTSAKITFSGYTFDIPNEYQTDIESDSLTIANALGNRAAAFEITTGKYSNLTADLKALQTMLQTNLSNYYGVDLAASLPQIKKFKNVEYVVSEITDGINDGKGFIVAYTSLSNTQILAITIINEATTIDHSFLEEIAPIANSASKSASKSFNPFNNAE